jgi:thiosulfate dehydrogenase [quinone] large subunit
MQSTFQERSNVLVDKKGGKLKAFENLFIVMRILLGLGWFMAGMKKWLYDGWFSEPGLFLNNYLLEAIVKPNVPEFYRYFIESFVIDHVLLFNHTIPIVQIILGLFVMLGVLTLPSILIILFMHINFILSGNMNLMSLTLYSSALVLLFSQKLMYRFSLDRYLEIEKHLTFQNRSVDQTMPAEGELRNSIQYF